jgi:hypothetical protein
MEGLAPGNPIWRCSLGLGDPLLVVCDGAAGIIKAIETCLPRSERQRCLAHRMRNLAAKVPEDRCPESKARAAGLVKDCETALPSSVACFMDDFEAAIAHLTMPITHRRAIRTTNLLERLFVEERRRLKIIPTPDEARLPLSGGDDGLGQPQGSRLAGPRQIAAREMTSRSSPSASPAGGPCR